MIVFDVQQTQVKYLVRFDFRNSSPVLDFWNVVSVTMENSGESGEIRWKLADGDIRRNEGKLRITRQRPEAEGSNEKTSVRIETQVEIGVFYPQFLVSMVAKTDVPKTLDRFSNGLPSLY
jgi:hypothetical protein